MEIMVVMSMIISILSVTSLSSTTRADLSLILVTTVMSLNSTFPEKRLSMYIQNQKRTFKVFISRTIGSHRESLTYLFVNDLQSRTSFYLHSYIRRDYDYVLYEDYVQSRPVVHWYCPPHK